MKITAVITCYESVTTIGLTLMSLYSQVRRPDEIIVTDDGSQETTCKYIQGLLDIIHQSSGMETRFTSHERKSPYRLNTVRNNGISLATGQLIFLVDGDILVPRNFLYEHENIHKLLSNQHKKALVSCMRMNITPEGSVVPTGVSEWCRRRDQYLSSRQWHQMDLKPEYTVSQSTFLKSDWDKVGGFDGDFDGYWGFDEIEFAFRLKKSGVLLTSHGIVHHIDEGPGAGNRNCDRNALLYKKKKEEWARRQQKQN